ncbi:MAG: DUF4230 domain-containing protein, partial [Cyanobacteria bacterium J06649_4]
ALPGCPAMKSRITQRSRERSVPYRSSRGMRSRDRAKTKRAPLLRILQLIAISTTGGAVMLGSLALFAFLRSGGQFFEEMKAALTPQPPEETVDVRTVVVEQVRNVSELTTAVFTMEAVVPAQSDRKLGELTIGQTNLLYVAYGEVRAGVDLEELTTADVVASETGNQITLELPAPKLLGTEIDVDRSDVYDYSRGFFNLGPDRGVELQSMAQREARVKIEQAACEQDILGQASDRAELVVRQLLLSAGFETVNITTETPPNTACIAQVAPVVPSTGPSGYASGCASGNASGSSASEPAGNSTGSPSE